MGKSLRYIIYLLIGMGLYYVLGADKDPSVLDKFHQYAPFFIILLAILLFSFKKIRDKREKGKDQ